MPMQSYISCSVADVLVGAEEGKNESTDWLLRLAMLPFHGLLSQWMVPWVKRLLCFLGCIGDQLSVAWGRGYDNVLGWLKARLGFAVIRAQYLFKGITCYLDEWCRH